MALYKFPTQHADKYLKGGTKYQSIWDRFNDILLKCWIPDKVELKVKQKKVKNCDSFNSISIKCSVLDKYHAS